MSMPGEESISMNSSQEQDVAIFPMLVEVIVIMDKEGIDDVRV